MSTVYFTAGFIILQDPFLKKVLLKPPKNFSEKGVSLISAGMVLHLRLRLFESSEKRGARRGAPLKSGEVGDGDGISRLD